MQSATMTECFTVRSADWAADEAAIHAVREQVFVIEQDVPPALEWDGLDEACRHAIAEDPAGNVVGTGRLHMDRSGAKIGRMAVLSAHRGKGIGALLLKQLLLEATSAAAEMIYLNAQTAVIDFYSAFGFEAEGPEFDEAGIPHRRMVYRKSNV